MSVEPSSPDDPATVHHLDRLTVRAPAQGLHEITADVGRWLATCDADTGVLTLYIRHTSASLLIQENEDPEVLRDLEGFFRRVVPEDRSLYGHALEGEDDMPAHIRGALTQTHLAIPVAAGEMLLGRYQGIFLFEHRYRTRPRELVLHFVGHGRAP